MKINNGVPIQPTVGDSMQLDAVEVFTDASGSGLGAYWPARELALRQPLPSELSITGIKIKVAKAERDKVSMMFLELLAILAAIYVWGNEWRGKFVLWTTRQREGRFRSLTCPARPRLGYVDWCSWR